MAVTLPPPLEEWLEERAATLEVDREEVLVQLVGAYRAAADLDDEGVSGFDDEGIDERLIEEVESRIRQPEPSGDVDELESRIETLESELKDNVEDVRNRIIQVRDAVKERAPKDHTHRELARLVKRVDGLADDLEGVGTEVTETAETVEELEDRLAEVESKLDRLARVVVSLRKQDGTKPSKRAERLDHIRRQANRHGITEATCAACDERVNIALLAEPACPHCGAEIHEVEPSDSVLGRTLGIRKARLTGTEPPALESDDE